MCPQRAPWGYMLLGIAILSLLEQGAALPAQEPCGPANCGGPQRGTCTKGVCVCRGGWFGKDCSIDKRDCPNDCNGYGKCVDGECHCIPGHSGTLCEHTLGHPTTAQKCPLDCQPLRGIKGKCNHTLGSCDCPAGYCGTSCFMEVTFGCPADCSGHGVCCAGQCQCSADYYGADCSEYKGTACPYDFGCDHGICQKGKCVCDWGWKGIGCDETAHVAGSSDLASILKKCPHNCYGHGKCANGECRCHWPFTGDHCEFGCAENCSSHGKCILSKPKDLGFDQCECDPGWTGDTCSLEGLTCPRDYDCMVGDGHGKCVKGRCKCVAGYSGFDCSVYVRAEARQIVCPDDCNGRGTCVQKKCHQIIDGKCVFDVNRWTEGECICDMGWRGVNCSIVYCPNNCTAHLGHGWCHSDKNETLYGKCECEVPWAQPDCLNATLVCPWDYDCNFVGKGTCIKGKCKCSPGYVGYDCHKAPAPQCKEEEDCGEGAECKPVLPYKHWSMCTCKEGYVFSGVQGILGDDIPDKNTSCLAVNNCKTNNGACHELAQCNFTGPGTNDCLCPVGYEGDGITECKEIDECSKANGGCDVNAVCENVGPGEAKCTCKTGFTGDGTEGGCTKTDTDAGMMDALYQAVQRKAAAAGHMISFANTESHHSSSNHRPNLVENMNSLQPVVLTD